MGLAGCSAQVQAPTQPEDASATIQTLVAKNSPLTYLHEFSPQNLPTDVYPEQFLTRTAQKLNNDLFVLIEQPNMNYFFPSLGDQVNWTGILLSTDNGTSWKKFFTVKDPIDTDAEARGYPGTKIRHNVVGLFINPGKLFVDVADARGAGSGEGNLTRLSTADGGKTWQKDPKCYYFNPMNYYEPAGNALVVDGKSVLEKIHPENANPLAQEPGTNVNYCKYEL